MVLLEDAFKGGIAREHRGDGACEVGVAVPARALATRAVHEHVDGVLAERLARRVENLHERGIARTKRSALRRGVLVAAEAGRRDGHLAGHRVQFDIAHRVGLEGIDLVDTRLGEVPDDDVTAVAIALDTPCLAVVGQDFVKLQHQPPWLLHLNTKPRETGIVQSVVEDD